MVNNSVKRELEKRGEDLVTMRADEITNYILRHMIDPPKTLRTLALDLQAAVFDLKKRRSDEH